MPNPPCVLVVDDDTAIRTLLAEALDSEGYTVATAINGADALVKLATLQDGGRFVGCGDQRLGQHPPGNSCLNLSIWPPREAS